MGGFMSSDISGARGATVKSQKFRTLTGLISQLSHKLS
jgi:hypothetical protein